MTAPGDCSLSADPLGDLQVVEVASYVAAPMAGLTLAQLGARVIRIDPPGGAPDRERWPLAPGGASLYWAGLNRGKRSVVVDVRRPEGQELVLALAAAGGHRGGVLIDNQPRARWLDDAAVRRARSDMVHARVLGRPDGGPSVDYTANAAAGVPDLTGPSNRSRPVNHVLPAWDLITGLHTALAILGAIRRRDTTGRGSHMTVSLDEVALSSIATLGWAAHAELAGHDRERHGNYVYGSYGIDFETADQRRVMVVALTARQWRALTEATGTTRALDAVSDAMALDLTRDEARFAAREVITAVLRPWFASRQLDEIAARLDDARVLWGPYRTITEAVAHHGADGRDDLLQHVAQPEVGSMLTAGHPVRGLARRAAAPAPVLGGDTVPVLTDLLGLTEREVGRLVAAGVVGVPECAPE